MAQKVQIIENVMTESLEFLDIHYMHIKSKYP